MLRPLLAAGLLIGFVVLGNVVSHGPPSPFDVTAHAALYGRGIPLATVLTELGRFPAYATMCAIGILFGIVRRAWLLRAVVSVVVLVLAMTVSDLYKVHFGRVRPPDQLVFFESSASYASGHAVLSLTFYGGWALYAWESALSWPLRIAAVCAAAALVVAISWSRLALGAHWLTDVLGGLLLGGAFLVLQAIVTRPAATPRNPFAR